jgi:hypothetical protein
MVLATVEKELFHNLSSSPFEQPDPVSGYEFEVEPVAGKISRLKPEDLFVDGEPARPLHVTHV